MKTLGLIPARKGSKSIPFKNRALLCGKPLVQWVIDAGKSSDLTYLICTTDDEFVMDLCEKQGVKVHVRPEHLSHGDRPIQEIVKAALPEGNAFDAVALLQPTSPFVTPEIINQCIKEFKPDINSVQTVSLPPHNHHAYNQRVMKHNFVFWRFIERYECYNKQLKPKFWIFGNLVITRTWALDSGMFAEPSIGIPVSRHEAVDIDGPEDLEYAEYLIERGKL